jgi:hypothetical protein
MLTVKNDLLDRAEAVHLPHALVARAVQQFVDGIVDRRDALEHLLVGRVRRDRRAAARVQYAFDRRAVQRFKSVRLAAVGQATVQRGRVGDQHFFEQHAQPGVPVVLLVGELEKRLELVAACVPLDAILDRLDHPAHLRHLVLARLDDQAQHIAVVGQRAQLGERHRLGRARRHHAVVCDREIELATRDRFDLRACDHRRHRLARAEPGARYGFQAGADQRERARHDALLDRLFRRHHLSFLMKYIERSKRSPVEV